MRSDKKINNLSQISDLYDAFLIDAWGVLHDGGEVFPHAYQCLQSLKLQAKTVVILSNAARRTLEFERLLRVSGIDSSLFDFTMSSGELFWKKYKNGSFPKYGDNCFYLGPQHSKGIIEELELTLVDSVEKADFMVNTGAEGNLSNAKSFTHLLENAVKKNLPMICANPDLIAIRKGIRGICAGAIATLYYQLGGEVEYVGKPYVQIYQECKASLVNIPKSRVLMIGDGLQTDILGANNFGIDSLFIMDGIYSEEIKVIRQNSTKTTNIDLEMLFEKEGAKPDFIIDKLLF